MKRKPEETPVWQTKSWQLLRQTIDLPQGGRKTKVYIEHPGSVVLVPLLGDQVVMIHQYRIALDAIILELPAGTREPDEGWRVCAQRELREETGYNAGNLVDLGAVWAGPGLTNERMHFYLATDLTHDPLPADDDEQIENHLLPLDLLVEMAYDGRLDDSKSVVGILRASHYLKGQAEG